MSNFGKNLLALRKSARLTQKELAEKLGVNVHTFIGYETAGYEPKFKTLVKISKYFGVSIDDLIREKSTDTESKIKAKQALVESVLALPPERIRLLGMLTQMAGEIGTTPIEGGGTQYNLAFTVKPKDGTEAEDG